MWARLRRNNMSWWKKFVAFITPPSTTELIRARNKKGRYVADDPSTPKNEAYVRVKKKSKKPKKI